MSKVDIQPTGLSAKDLGLLDSKGFDKVAPYIGRQLGRRFRRVIRELVLQQYRQISDLMEKRPQLLPSWMTKDAEGAITVYPGTPSEVGFAIHKEEVYRVPSIYGPGGDLGKRKVQTADLGIIVNKILQAWGTGRFSRSSK